MTTYGSISDLYFSTIACIDCKILQFAILKKWACYLNLYLCITSYIMEQLTYDSSSSEDDIQIVEHDSETDSDDQDVAPPTKKQIMDLKAKKKVSAAMKISVIMERQIPISKFSGS